MKNSRFVAAMLGIALIIAIGAIAGRTASAAPPTVNLGTAAFYSVLAGTPAVTNTGATTIDRDVGIHPATSVTGFPPGIVGGTIHAGDAAALQAKSDLVAAYLDAAGRPVTATYAALGGLPPLVAGVYNSGPATLDLTGTLTLDGQNDPSSVWIFQAQSDLVTASTSSVVFVNGGSPCNVFWQITSSAALGSGSTFVGTILALTSVTLANGVTVNGRALARNGTVTMINDTFITSTCTALSVAIPPALIPPTRPPFTVAPSATPTVAPTTTPIATTTVAPIAATATTPAATATPTVVFTPAPVIAGVQTLPSTSTDEQLSPLLILAITLGGVGVLMLLRGPIRHL